MYTNILIPTDGSELAEKAVQHGIALSKRIGAKATMLTVLTPFSHVHDRHADDGGHAGSVQDTHEGARRENPGRGRGRSASSRRRMRDGPG
jgi:nucleotide-binding universal stress UspA family protein